MTSTRLVNTQTRPGDRADQSIPGMSQLTVGMPLNLAGAKGVQVGVELGDGKESLTGGGGRCQWIERLAVERHDAQSVRRLPPPGLRWPLERV